MQQCPKCFEEMEWIAEDQAWVCIKHGGFEDDRDRTDQDYEEYIESTADFE